MSSFLMPNRTKASQTQSAIVRTSLPGPVYPRANHTTLIEKLYKPNVWVYAAVRERTNAVKNIPLTVSEVKGGDLVELGRTDFKGSQDPVAELLAKPNEEQGKGSFIESSFGFWDLTGNMFIEAVLSTRHMVDSTSLRVSELWPLRPDRMAPKPSTAGDQKVGGWTYTVAGQRQHFTAEQIMHVKHFDPTDDWWGLSPLQVVMRAALAHNSGMEWNVALLQNKAMPGGGLKTKGELSDPEYERLTEEIKATWSGAKNAGRPMILEGDMDWVKMSLDPAEMMWLEGMEDAAYQICGAYNVGPELVGLKTGTYENRSEARKALYAEAAQPSMDHWLEDLNIWLPRLLERDIVVGADWSQVSALQEDKHKMWDRVTKAEHLTVNEKRQETGQDTLGPEGDVVLVPLTMVPLSMAKEPRDDGDGKKGNKAVDGDMQIWQAVNRRRDVWVTRTDVEVSKVFDAERRAITKAMRDADDLDTAQTNALAALDPEPWVLALTGLWEAMIDDFADDAIRQFSDLEGIESLAAERPWRAAASAFIRKHVPETVRFLIDVTAAQLVKVITTEQPDVRAARALVKEVYDRQFKGARANLISEVHVLSGSSFGRQAGAREAAGLVEKQWITQQDDRVRDSHAADEPGTWSATHGQTVGMDDFYLTGMGNSARFPGDPILPIEDKARCRCTEKFVRRDR